MSDFEDIVGAERCPTCKWTTLLHAPDCDAGAPAAEYTVTGRGLMRPDGSIVGEPVLPKANDVD